MTVVVVANFIAVAAVLVPGYFAWRSTKRQATAIEVNVDGRLSEALDKITALETLIEQRSFDKTAGLEAEVERLGGAVAMAAPTMPRRKCGSCKSIITARMIEADPPPWDHRGAFRRSGPL